MISDKCQHISCRDDAFEAVFVPVGKQWRRRDFCLKHVTDAMRNGAVDELPEGAICEEMNQKPATIQPPPPAVVPMGAQVDSPPLDPVMSVEAKESLLPMKNDTILEWPDSSIPSPVNAETDVVSVETAPAEDVSVEVSVTEVYAPATEPQQVTTLTVETLTTDTTTTPNISEKVKKMKPTRIEHIRLEDIVLKSEWGERDCALLGCQYSHKGRGMCTHHYAHFFKYCKNRGIAMPDYSAPKRPEAANERRARDMMIMFPDMPLTDVAKATNLPLARVEAMHTKSHKGIGRKGQGGQSQADQAVVEQVQEEQTQPKCQVIYKTPDPEPQPPTVPEVPPQPEAAQPQIQQTARVRRMLPLKYIGLITVAPDADKNPAICRIFHCVKNAKARGLCQHHYDVVQGTELFDQVALPRFVKGKPMPRKYNRKEPMATIDRLKTILKTLLEGTGLSVEDAITDPDPVAWAKMAEREMSGVSPAGMELGAKRTAQLKVVIEALGYLMTDDMDQSVDMLLKCVADVKSERNEPEFVAEADVPPVCADKPAKGIEATISEVHDTMTGTVIVLRAFQADGPLPRAGTKVFI